MRRTRGPSYEPGRCRSRSRDRIFQNEVVGVICPMHIDSCSQNDVPPLLPDIDIITTIIPFERTIKNYETIRLHGKHVFTRLLGWAKNNAITSGSYGYCAECYVDLGKDTTRQLCGKYYCKYDGAYYLSE